MKRRHRMFVSAWIALALTVAAGSQGALARSLKPSNYLMTGTNAPTM